MVPLRTWLWVMQLASSVVSSALSRERERQADLAAVRYTRDPLALAEALPCPACGAALVRAPYEGISIALCDRCGGRLVTTAEIGKLLARREAAFTEDQKRLADLLEAGGDRLRRAAVLARGRPGVALIPCPRCAAPMMRQHYSCDYAVEVDSCRICDLTWFEKDELEALQLLVEQQTG